MSCSQVDAIVYVPSIYGCWPPSFPVEPLSVEVVKALLSAQFQSAAELGALLSDEALANVPFLRLAADAEPVVAEPVVAQPIVAQPVFAESVVHKWLARNVHDQDAIFVRLNGGPEKKNHMGPF
ncbi:hypothetical protein SLEP1_g39829 [Rubroshorea leprosula]|uniref:Uncharacterized protein n=1 Tax=Rubroshorea leprosula TaxID=152421 RepID=A0AAV5L298_9ROSI|nr:hypothetical protein SLEP1_g39829 [Rubroshorea leprosula]